MTTDKPLGISYLAQRAIKCVAVESEKLRQRHETAIIP
jgi:hypothetical protein